MLNDPNFLAIANSLITTIGLGFIVYNTYLSRRTELNTNSMKDALVLSTSKLSHATGLAEGLAKSAQEGKKEREEVAKTLKRKPE